MSTNASEAAQANRNLAIIGCFEVITEGILSAELSSSFSLRRGSGERPSPLNKQVCRVVTLCSSPSERIPRISFLDLTISLQLGCTAAVTATPIASFTLLKRLLLAHEQ